MQKETKHYIFNFEAGSEAEKDIDLIAETQEKAYKKITDFVGGHNPRIIHYFLYPSREIKGKATGDDGNGNAYPKSFEVHAVYNDKIKCIGPHEDTHLLTVSLGLPPQLFREGLAEYFSETWHDKSHLYWAKKFKQENKLYSIAKMMNDDFWYETNEMISYPQAGAFVGFLIKKIGKEKFLELYKALSRHKSVKENESTFFKIRGKTVGEIEKKWLSSL